MVVQRRPPSVVRKSVFGCSPMAPPSRQSSHPRRTETNETATLSNLEQGPPSLRHVLPPSAVPTTAEPRTPKPCRQSTNAGAVTYAPVDFHVTPPSTECSSVVRQVDGSRVPQDFTGSSAAHASRLP